MFRWIKKLALRRKDVEQELNWLHRFILTPGLWKFHKDSIERGVGIGLFVACLPIPLQMVLAIVLAIWFRANLPTAAALTLINNPFTFIPINLFIYKIGAWLVGDNLDHPLPPEWNWVGKNFQEYLSDFIAWIPSLGVTYFIGLVVLAGGSALMGYLLTRLIFVLYTSLKK